MALMGRLEVDMSNNDDDVHGPKQRIINPRRACAARVTVLGVCVSVCVSVCGGVAVCM